MVNNRFAPAFGWDGVDRVKDYLRVIDDILGEENAGMDILFHEVKKYIEDYYTKDEIKDLKKDYGRDWKDEGADYIVGRFIDNNELKKVVNIISEVIEDEMKKRGRTIEEVYDSMIPPYEDEKELETYIENEDYDGLLDIVENAGLMSELVRILEKYMR
jgi:hypothetical protein